MRSWHTLSLLELNQISTAEDIKIDSVSHSDLDPYHQYALAYHFNALGLVSDFIFLQQTIPNEATSFLPPLDYQDVVLYVNKEQAEKTWACLIPLLFTENRNIKQVIVSNPLLSLDMMHYLSAQKTCQKNKGHPSEEQEALIATSRDGLLDESHWMTYEENENYLRIFISVDVIQQEDLMSVIQKLLFEEYVDPIYLESPNVTHQGLPAVFHHPNKLFNLEEVGEMALFRHDIANRTLFYVLDKFDEIPSKAWVFFKAWFDTLYVTTSEYRSEQDVSELLQKLIRLAIDYVTHPVRDIHAFIFNCHIIHAFLNEFAAECRHAPEMDTLLRCYDFRLEADMLYQEYNLTHQNAVYKKRDEQDDYDYEAINPLLKNIASKAQCLLFVANEAEYQEIKNGFEANSRQAKAPINPALPALNINQRILLFRSAQKFEYFDSIVESKQIKPWSLTKV